jgi:hypothetical protein
MIKYHLKCKQYGKWTKCVINVTDESALVQLEGFTISFTYLYTTSSSYVGTYVPAALSASSSGIVELLGSNRFQIISGYWRVVKNTYLLLTRCPQVFPR